MLTHEKSLVKRLENEPFALIGINTDGDAVKVKEIVAQQGITWRQHVDGSKSGPLSSSWNVVSWPMFYVIDAKGVIRYRDLPFDELERAVTKLIAEAKASKQ